MSIFKVSPKAAAFALAATAALLSATAGWASTSGPGDATYTVTLTDGPSADRTTKVYTEAGGYALGSGTASIAGAPQPTLSVSSSAGGYDHVNSAEARLDYFVRVTGDYTSDVVPVIATLSVYAKTTNILSPDGPHAEENAQAEVRISGLFYSPDFYVTLYTGNGESRIDKSVTFYTYVGADNAVMLDVLAGVTGYRDSGSGTAFAYADPTFEIDPDFLRTHSSLGLAFSNGIGNGAVAGGAVPEPAAWAMMLVGFGGLGAVLRRRRATLAAA